MDTNIITLQDLDFLAKTSSPQAGWARQEAIRRRAEEHEEDPEFAYPEDRWPSLQKRDFSRSERDSAAASGDAMPDGSYPIKNEGDLSNAVQAFGRHPTPAVKEHIKEQAADLGDTEALPDKWKKRVKKLNKALRQLPVQKESPTALKPGHIIRDPLHGHVTVDQTGTSASTGHPAVVAHTPDGRTVTLGFKPEDLIDVLHNPFVPHGPSFGGVDDPDNDGDSDMITGCND